MKNKEDARISVVLYGLILLELTVLIFFVSGLLLPYVSISLAGVGEDNVTVVTLLDVGNVFPEVLNVTINSDVGNIDLSANSTVDVNVTVIARDYNGEADITNVSVTFFDNVASSLEASDDRNEHYTNSTCSINSSYGDAYEISAECTITLYYYANNATWNATATAIDNSSLNDSGSSTVTVNTLLAFQLPDTIDYGEVNATEVSPEREANVTNAGNVELNLSLSGYAGVIGDNWSMNCTVGNVRNISIFYEKFNLTNSNTSTMTLGEFESQYQNLTTEVVTKEFNLDYRRNDTAPYIDDTNATYWRIYVPVGVAGTCSGNIVFGAVQATGS